MRASRISRTGAVSPRCLAPRSAGPARRRAALPAATLALLLAGPATALAAPCSLSTPLSTWGLGASGDWNTSSHWTPSGVPNSGSQNVCIVDGTSTVTLDISASVAGLQLASGNGLSFDPGVSLNLNGPQAINDGVITVNGGGGTNTFLNIAGNTTLSGSGTLQLNVASGGGSAFIQQSGGSFTLTNTGNTIQGAGVIGNGGLTVVNQATVDANASTQTLTLNGSGGVTNSGLLEATSGGTLQISAGIANAGGTIEANGGTVNNSSAITGGTLTTAGGGTLQSAGTGTLTNVTISTGSTYTNATGNTTNLNGAIVNQGTLALAAGSAANGILNITSNTTLSGGGALQMSVAAGGGNSFIEQSGGSFTLTNTGNTIEGTGIIGNGGLTVVNQATIDANASTQTLTLNGSGGVTNSGLLEATGGGTLQISTGIANAGGTIEANGGTVNNSSAITGGTLTSTGTSTFQSAGTGTLTNVTISTGSTYTNATGNTTNINGAIVNQGTLALAGGGGANGILNITSATTLSGGGALQMSVNPTSGGNAFIEQSGGSFTLTNADNTIEGAGVIGNGGLTLLNQSSGTVDANAAGQTLVLNGSGNVVNQGKLEASNTGTLLINNLVNNAGATITADNGTVSLESATIQAGTLGTSHGGVIQTAPGQSATLDGRSIIDGGQGTLTNAGNYLGASSSTTSLEGTIINTGTITLNGGGGVDTLLNIVGNTTLSGSGTLQMNVAAGGGSTFIEQSGGGFTLTNAGTTIKGAGFIGNGGLTFVNQATVDANASGQALTLNGSGGVTNTATLEATGGGTLQISTGITNTGGTIEANGGTVNNSSTITGGTLTSTGTSTFQSAGTGTLTNLTISTGSTYTNATGNTTNINGSIVNQGTLALAGGGGADGLLNITSATTLSGGGTLQMSVNPTSGGNAFVEQSGGSFTLTNTDNTIEGSGVIGNGGLTFVNNATVNANASTQALTLNGSGGVTNTATLEATGGGTLQISTGITNSGGTIEANGGTVNNSSTITGGTLTSTGTSTFQSAGTGTLTNLTISSGSTYTNATGNTTNLNGSIVNQGTLALAGGGGLNGLLNITSDTTLSGGGTLQMSVNPTSGGNAFIEQSGGGFTLINTDNSIEGAGVIGNGGLTFVNNATVNANASTQALTLNGSGGVTNGGLLEATGGGTLNIQTGIANSGGTITANGGTVNNFNAITGGTLTSTTGPGTLFQSAGTGTLTNVTISSGSTYTNATGNTTNLNGSIVNQGTLALAGGGGANGLLNITSDTTLSGGGALQMSVAGGGGSAFIEQSGGGFTLTNADNTIEGAGVIGNGGLTFINQAAGTVNANAGATLLLNGSGGVTNSGTFIASDGSTLSVTAPLTNFSGGTLTGGTYQSVASGHGATLSVANGPITTDAANITLSGAGSVFTANGTPLETSLTTIASTGQLHVLNNRNYATTNDIANAGLLELGGGTFTANSLTNSGTLLGFGTQTSGNGSQLANTGLVHATGGTLVLTPGVSGPTGNITIDPGASLDLSGSTTGNTVGTLLHNGTDLNLGSSNITVSADYNNASFGVGNAFNNHANVTGSGLILAAGNVGMTVTGTGISGGATPMLALGNVHVGSSGTGMFDVNNTGTTGPVLRGAVQTAGLSNPAFGLTAQNFGPIALGGSTPISYTFNPLAAGALSGQSFKVVSNFDNVAPITVGVTGAAYALASPTVASSLTPAFNFGVVQVGHTYTDPLTITNALVASSAAFQEGLNASFGSPSNPQLTTNGGTIANLTAGTSNSSAMSVILSPVTAGTIGGTVPISFASNGATTSGLGITPLAGQTLSYTWRLTAINQANPSITPTSIDFGNVRIGTTQQQALSVTNIAGTPPQASLDAQISAVGPATSNGGTINQLAPGATDTTSLIAGLSTASAGLQSGVATVALQSDATPAGCTSSCIVNLPSQAINVKGTVYRLANPVLNTPSVTLAARVGNPAPSQALSITNSSPDSFTEALKAGFGAISSPFSGSGTISGLAAQGTDASSLNLSLSTATSGTFTGTAAVNFTSTGAGTDNAPDLSLGAGSVNLTGKVYTPAVAAVTSSVNFGIVHVGDVVANLPVAVSNTATGALTDVITGGFIAPPPGSPFMTSGNLGAGVAAGTSSNALQIGLNTSTSGVFSAQAHLGLNSHDADLADLALSTGPVQLNAQVNNFAIAAFAKTGGNGTFGNIGSSYTLNFGTLNLHGASQNAALAVLNAATGLADLLDGSFTISSGGGEFGLTGFNDFTDSAAGQSEALSVLFDPSSIGSFNEVIDLAGIGHNASGFSESLPATLTLEARVTSAVPTPEPGSLAILATALAGLVGFARRRAERTVARDK